MSILIRSPALTDLEASLDQLTRTIARRHI